MNWGIVFIVLIVLYFMIKPSLPVKGVLNITTSDVKAKLKDRDIQFVDVRTAHEYSEYHKKSFMNIPLEQLANRYHELDKEKEVVLICQSGMRSIRASRILKQKGFNNIYHVKGGLSTWVK